jgi:hypothetical protein
MFGFGKQKIPLSGAVTIVMTYATMLPKQFAKSFEPLSLDSYEAYNSEIFALSYSIAIISIQESGLSGADAQRLSARFTGTWSDFISRNLAGDKSATAMLINHFQQSYLQYRHDISEQAMAEIFLRRLGVQSPHPTVRLVSERSIFAGQMMLNEQLTQLAKTRKIT